MTNITLSRVESYNVALTNYENSKTEPENNGGWIKVFRKLMMKGYYKDSHYVHLWIHLLFCANHHGQEILWNGSLMRINRGQVITGRKKLAKATGINESKIERVLAVFEKERQIEQQKFSKFRLITIVNYDSYQANEQQVNNRRTTGEHKQECNKNDKNIYIAPPAGDIVDNLLKDDGGIKYDFQYVGLEIFEKTGAPKEKKSECIRIAKLYPNLVTPAMSFCLDYPNPKLKWKMFLWKLNQLIKNAPVNQ